MESEIISEYVKWYHIAQKIVNDEAVIPKLSEDKVKDRLSRANWLLLVAPYSEKEESKFTDEPNIFLRIVENTLILGLSFNNVPAVERLIDSLDEYNKETRLKIIEVIKKLGPGFEVSVEKRIWRKNYAAKPEFEDVSPFPMKAVDMDNSMVSKIIDTVNALRKECLEHTREARGKDGYYREAPSVSLAYIEFKKNEESFSKNLMKLVNLYKLCVSVKSKKQIREIKSKEESDKKKVESLEKRLKHLEFTKDMPMISDAQRKEMEEEIKKVSKELDKLKN